MNNRKSTVGLSEKDDLLLFDRNEIADNEARNGLLQFDEVRRLIFEHAPQKSIIFDRSLLQNLNRIAIAGIRRSAGQLRLTPIHITNTPHVPPSAVDVPRLLDEMCAYVSGQWASGDDVSAAIHLSAYVMWRLNWIHPFRDGNGRTSRAASYLVLGVRLGRELVGTPTIADHIVDNKQPYYEALDAADAAWRNAIVDVSMMEALIADLLVMQLSSV